ncbi:MAG TPA: chemotaxis protein CheB [Ktedonobacterales bacterium]|nr:chemotaxis protein CheB [Ktedonobacterales bacterium]
MTRKRDASRPNPHGAAAGHDIIVIGTSTGGVEALISIVRDLPPNLPAAVFVVLHLSPQSPSHLPDILARNGDIPAVHPHDGEPIQHGRIYVAPPDFHMLVEEGRVRVVRGPRENRHRPAVDPLFQTAAVAYGSHVIGVVLTGALDDGTAGLHAVKERGGIAIVQDPNDALISSMPANAMNYAAVDYILPLALMGTKLAQLVHEPAPDEQKRPISAQLKFESNMVRMDEATMQSEVRPGRLSAFTCPACKGPLWELRDGELLHCRCRVGHSFTGESMLVGQSEYVDEALWAAYNTLNESAIIAQRLAQDSRTQGHTSIADRFEERARLQRSRAHILHGVLEGSDHTIPVNDQAAPRSLPEVQGVQMEGEERNWPRAVIRVPDLQALALHLSRCEGG